jgi:hypothetical protein
MNIFNLFRKKVVSPLSSFEKMTLQDILERAPIVTESELEKDIVSLRRRGYVKVTRIVGAYDREVRRRRVEVSEAGKFILENF